MQPEKPNPYHSTASDKPRHPLPDAWPYRAHTPLRLIFWGALLCVLDFRINGIDLLPDIMGLVLILGGVWPLGNYCSQHPHYEASLVFIRLMAAIAVIRGALQMLPGGLPPQLAPAWPLLGLLNLAAIVLFARAMMWMSQDFQLQQAAASWHRTSMLFAVIYGVPLGILYIWSELAILTGQPFRFNLGPAALLIIVAFVIPLVHFFVSTSRMIHETQAAAPWA